MATSVDYQIQLHEVDASGNTTKMSPKNRAADVVVGSLSAGSLTLPGNSATETLSDTLKNIKKYLSNLATLAASARSVTSSLTSTSTTDLATAKAVSDLKAGQDTINSTLNTHATNISGKAPTSHAASGTTYGQATGSLYGHVKMSDTYSSKVDNAAAANGIAASQNALYNAYNGLNTTKAPNNHASSAATYGKGTSSVFGHLKISDTYTSAVSGGNADGAIAASQNAVYNAYNALKKTVDSHTTSISGKAPTSHATSGTTYGAGTGTNYGHVKLSDNYSTDTSSTGAAANGVAASNWAVYRAYTAAIGDANTKVNNHAATRGTASAFGHVKLSDNYTSSAGAASASIGASSKAVYDCYATLLSSINSLKTSVNNLNSVLNPSFMHLRGDGDSGFQAESTTTGACISFIANREGYNGIYDERKGYWPLIWNATNDDGEAHGGRLARVYTNNEGGNMELRSPSNTLGLEMDLYNDTSFRAYVFDVDPWKYISDFGYSKPEDKWWVSSGFGAPAFYENDVPLSDKYVQCTYALTHHVPGKIEAGHIWWEMLHTRLSTEMIAKKICTVNITYLNVPAGGSIKYYMAVGQHNADHWLYNNYSFSGYRARLKGSITNDTGVKNNITITHTIFIGDAVAESDYIFLESNPSYAFGVPTDVPDLFIERIYF